LPVCEDVIDGAVEAFVGGSAQLDDVFIKGTPPEAVARPPSYQLGVMTT